MGTCVCWRHGEGCVSVTVWDECVEGQGEWKQALWADVGEGVYVGPCDCGCGQPYVWRERA